MRILHVTPAYVPSLGRGGAVESVHVINREIAALGVEVTVYTGNFDGVERIDVPIDTPVDRDGVSVLYFRNLPPSLWSYSRELHRAIKKHAAEFDLIHATSVFLAHSTLAARYAGKNGVPYVISPRGSLMKEPMEKRSSFKKHLYLSIMEKRNLRGAVLHFTMPVEKEEYISQGLPLMSSFTIPNAFDPRVLGNVPGEEFRRSHNIPADAEVVLSLSRIDRKKGFDTLVPAFARVSKKRDKALLVVAGGDEGYLGTLNRLVSDHGIGDRFLFVGKLDRERAGSAFRGADVFVLPSYYENFGQTVLEAMYCGAPPVITPEVGVAPYVSSAQAGLVVEKDDEGFADAIRRILSEKENTERMRENGKRCVEEQFSPHAIAARFVEEYNHIIRGT